MAVIDRIITYAKAAMTAAQRAAGATRVVAYNTTTSKLVYPDGSPADAFTSAQTAAILLSTQQTQRPLRIALMGNSITRATAIRPGTTVTAGWSPSTVFSVNNVVGPKFDDITGGCRPIKWVCTTGGTTGLTEPLWKWSDTVGTTYTDGTVVWTATADTTTPFVSWASGFWTYAQQRTGQRFQEVCFNGRSGEKAMSIMAYRNRMLACNPDIVFYANVWENDCTISPSLSQVQTDWASFVALVDADRALGKTVWMATVLPSGNIDASSAFTGYSAGVGTKCWQWLNKKIREFAAARRDVVLVAWEKTCIDPNPSNPVWPDNSTTFGSAAGSGQGLKWTDAIHPQTNGHWALSDALVSVINAVSLPVDHFGVAIDDNAITTNPLGFGSSGTKDATITTGTVPNSLTAAAFGGTAASCSVAPLARTDRAGFWTRIIGVASAASATSDALSVTNTTSMSVGNFVAGDVVQGFGESKISANPTLLTAVEFRCRMIGAASSWFYSNLYVSGDQDIASRITTDTTLILKTPPVLFQASTTGVSTFMRANWRGAASVTMHAGQACIKRVAANVLV